MEVYILFAGKIIYFDWGHRKTMAMLVITRWYPIYSNEISWKAGNPMDQWRNIDANY